MSKVVGVVVLAIVMILSVLAALYIAGVWKPLPA